PCSGVLHLMQVLPAILLLGLLVASAGSAAQVAAQKDETFETTIPEPPLAGALQSPAEQIGVQVVCFSRATEGLTARPHAGSVTRRQALNALLRGTGLRYVFLNADSVAIQPVPETEQHAAALPSPADAPRPPPADAQ